MGDNSQNHMCPSQMHFHMFNKLTQTYRKTYMKILKVLMFGEKVLRYPLKKHVHNPKPVGHGKSSPKEKVHSNIGTPQETRKKSNK